MRVFVYTHPLPYAPFVGTEIHTFLQKNKYTGILYNAVLAVVHSAVDRLASTAQFSIHNRLYKACCFLLTTKNNIAEMLSKCKGIEQNKTASKADCGRC